MYCRGVCNNTRTDSSSECNFIKTEPSVISGCGGIVNVNPGRTVTITSPHYPSNYISRKTCVWVARVMNFNNISDTACRLL